MTRRELPPSEWHRITGDLAVALQLCAPGDLKVGVVEDDWDQILGHWAAFQRWHAEGVYVDPAHRGKAAVARLLLEQMREMTGATKVLTGANTPAVARLLERHGATKIDATEYVLCL